MKLYIPKLKISNNSNLKNGLLYTCFSFLNNGISFILLLILAKYLIPEQYGNLNLFTSIINIFSVLISLSTNGYISISFFQKSIDKLREIIVIVILTSTIVLILISISIFIFHNDYVQLSGMELKYLWIALFICYFQIFNNINLDIWRLEEQPKKYGIYSLSFGLLNFILSLMLVVQYHMGWTGRVYSWFCLSFAYSFMSVLILKKRHYLKFRIPPKYLIIETLEYALPLVPHLVAYWFKQGFDRFIINYYYDTSEVGLFSFSMNLAAIITIIGNAFNSSNSVYIFKKLSDGYQKSKLILNKQCKFMTIIFILMGILVMISSFILIIYFMPKYRQSLIYTIPLCVGAIAQCIYLLWVNFLFYYKKTSLLMWISLSSALLQVPLSIFFTKYSCLNTAIISMCISIITMLVVIFFTKKSCFRTIPTYKS